MTLTIDGQVPAKKNSRQLLVRNGRILNIPSKTHREWEKIALAQINNLKNKTQFTEKVTIAYQFYVKDNRKRDIDNMIASVNDILTQTKIIKDDSWQHLAIGGADAEIDTKRPRVKLWISAD